MIYYARKARYMQGYSYTMSASTAFQKSVTKMLVKSADVSSTTSTYTAKWCKSENKTGTILPYNLWFFQYGSFWCRKRLLVMPQDNTRSSFPVLGHASGRKPKRYPATAPAPGQPGRRGRRRGPHGAPVRRRAPSDGTFEWCQGKWLFKIVIKRYQKLYHTVILIYVILSYLCYITILIAISDWFIL